MLLKYTQAQKRVKPTGIGKPQRTTGGMVKLTSGLMTVVPKIHRKVIKVSSKRPSTIHRTPTAVKREQIPVDPCENSNDSGLGFDHHVDYHSSLASHSAPIPTHALRFSDKEAVWQTEESPEVKRRRLEIKLESDDANDNFTFPETVRQQVPRTICAGTNMPVRSRGRMVVPLTLTSQLSAISSSGLTQLVIACQPEQQHRARYQTEGSRGAVKDRTGNGFPVVKLVGYDRPALLQVFIGTDQGRVAPHMFYQACRVSGKNSTPCAEKKIDGTIVIEVDMEPAKEMVVTCDCVGILKERNVDVEHRFPEEGTGRSKKKSTRCRMVFRTTITNPDGSQETLQVTSQPIVCTQPPGVPEICKKSLSSCSVRGGQELFILGKNFLKDTRVVFQEGESGNPSWSQSVQPDKEFLQQSHLVCVVPAYKTVDISEPVSVRLIVESSGKASEPHSLVYLPDHSVLAPEGNIANNSAIAQGGSTGVREFPSHNTVPAPLLLPSESPTPFMVVPPMHTSPGKEEKVHPVIMWEKPAEVMMPPPPPPLLPISVRRSSVQMIVPDQINPEDMKTEISDSVDPPKPIANVTDLSSTRSPSMDTFHRFVSKNSLPSINVSSYLSNLESNSIYSNKVIKQQLMTDVPQVMIPPPESINKPLYTCESSNLLTTVESVINNHPSAIQFDSINPVVNSSVSQSQPEAGCFRPLVKNQPHSQQESMGVIVNSSMVQKITSETLTTHDMNIDKQLAQPQNNGLDIELESVLQKQAPSMTERLDAFVNSAAESHISPNPEATASISMTSVITENTAMNPMCSLGMNRPSNTEGSVPPITQATSLPVSPHIITTNVNNGSICSLLSSSSQPSSNQALASLQASLDHLNNQNVNAPQASVMQPQSQVSDHQVQVQTLSNLQASLEQQLSAQSVTSPLSQAEMNNLIQSSPQSSSSQMQELSNIQATLEQQLSPRIKNVTNHSDMNNLLQSSHQSAMDQEESLSNLQVKLEHNLPPESIISSQMTRAELNNLLQTPHQESTNQVQTFTDPTFQVSLEQPLSSQTLDHTQMIHSESVQQRNIVLNNMGSAMQSPTQAAVNQAQALSNLQESLEHHMAAQVINSVQASHDSLNGNGMSLNSSVPASPTQAIVSQAQVLSNLQATLDHHLSSQVISPPQSMMQPMTQNPLTQNTLSASMDTSTQEAVSQAQALSDLQMSLGQMTSQVLTQTQSLHKSITNSHSLSNSPLHSTSEMPVSQAQVLSNLQASLQHHLNNQVMGTTQISAGPMMPMESMTNAMQSSPPQPPNQSIPSLQASIEQLSSQVLNPVQSNHSESLTTNNISLSGSQNIGLTSQVTLMSSESIKNVSNSNSVSSPVILSPTSRHSPTSVLTPSGITMSNSPTMALSPPNMAMHNTQPMEVNTSDIVMNNPQTLLNKTLSMSNPNLTVSKVQIHPHNTSHQPGTINQFEQVNTNISQGVPFQVATLNHYEQRSEMQSTGKEVERKESSAFMAPSRTIGPQAAPQTIKKTEEGMPLPHELTQMSEHDLIRFINPSCFDTV